MFINRGIKIRRNMSNTFAHRKGNKVKKRRTKGSDLIVDGEELHENGKMPKSVRSAKRRQVKIALQTIDEEEIEDNFLIYY